MNKTHVENLIEYLETHWCITMAIAIREFNCYCLSQTVTKANKRLAVIGSYIEDIKCDGGYAVYMLFN